MTSHSWSGSAFPVAARDCCPHFGQPRATLWKAGLLGLVGTLCTSMSAICGRLCIRGDPHKVEVRLRLDDQRAGRVRGCVGSHVQGRVGGWPRRKTNCRLIAYSGLLFPALTVVGLPVSTASFEHGHDDDGVCGRHLGQAFGHQKIGWIRHRNVPVLTSLSMATRTALACLMNWISSGFLPRPDRLPHGSRGFSRPGGRCGL